MSLMSRGLAGVPITICSFIASSPAGLGIYLFRDEYIFDVEKAVVVETPQLGHATSVFAKPRKMDNFVALYIKLTRLDIRRNRNNVAEWPEFLGRVVHGDNPTTWLKGIRQRTRERIDSTVID